MELQSVNVAFAYGASDRSGADEADELVRGLGLSVRPLVLDWGQVAWNPAPSLEGYLGRDRFDDRLPAEAMTAERTAKEEAAYAARLSALATEAAVTGLGGPTTAQREALALPSIPPWLRRLAFRAVARRIAASYLTLSDAMHYLARGEEIRSFVGEALLAWAAEVPQPRVAIGLSLGGTILVDVLTGLQAEGERPADVLITLGSQAPVLYGFDALASMRPVAPKTPPFTPWVNIWNPDDLLSFQVRGMIDVPGVRDVTITDPEAFPDNHGRYLVNEEALAAMRDAMALSGSPRH